MEEILRRGNLRLVLEGTHYNLSRPRAQFSKIHLHIHRINLVDPAHRLSDIARFRRDSHFSSNVPLLFLLDEETRNQAVSALISRVDSTDRSSAESAKQAIIPFVQRMAYLSLEIPTGTLEIVVHLWITLLNGTPWQDSDSVRDRVSSVPKLLKFAGGMGGDDSDEARQRCAICWEDFVQGTEVMSPPCNHVFHRDCIAKWMRAKRSCPLCRLEF